MSCSVQRGIYSSFVVVIIIVRRGIYSSFGVVIIIVRRESRIASAKCFLFIELSTVDGLYANRMSSHLARRLTERLEAVRSGFDELVWLLVPHAGPTII